jgi:hypothetical protein
MDMSVDDPGGPAKSKAAPKPRLADGLVLNDRYQIDTLIGHSVYGEIYRARDKADGKLVTIKALAPQLVADAAVRQRLEREIQIAVQLDHKNIATTFGLFGATVGNDPVAYLASEHVDGQTLREMMNKKREAGKTFSLKGAYNVVAHLCNALVYAHGATFHGGLSAESVQVNNAGRVKVTDFGLARMLRARDNFEAQVGAGGLPAMAPEMASAPEGADGRADIYAVGVILYELLTGRAPTESFERPSAAAQGVPPAVDEVVERCLRPQPDDRYPDAQAVKEALHTALANELGATPAEPAGAARPPAPARPAPPRAPTASAPPPAPARAPGAPSVATSAPAKPAQGKSAAAMSAVDDQTERWMIQKDRMDFGPFSMREVRSQVEGGKILGEHTIVDTETQERRKVRDHPQLRELVLETGAKLAEKERQEQEDADRRRHRGRVVSVLGAMFVVVVATLGGGYYYGLKHHWWEQKIVRQVVQNQDLDFLKNIEISMKVDPPVKKTTRRVPKKGGKPGEFDEVTNLGDASSEGGDETLDQAVVQRVMSQNFRVLVGCIQEERRRNPGMKTVDMDFIIKGTGLVSAVKVNGQTGTPVAGCMYGKMQTVTFPKFNGAKTHASFSLALK